MELLKNKQLWITFIFLLSIFVLSHWLFGDGWMVIKGNMSFKQSIEKFEFPVLYLVISGIVAFVIARRK